jgi:hypothetical protein
LFDGSDPVVWVNDFLADLKAHRNTSIDFNNQTLARMRFFRVCQPAFSLGAHATLSQASGSL